MNIQLFLNNDEVELTEQIKFPLNRCFQNISSPTDIIVNYSKSIDIPITKHNNKIFGNIYRIDKLIIDSGNDLGIYFDPTKKIDFHLIYNGNEIMKGYAKFQSAIYSANKGAYRINLFSTLGDIFQKLKSVVVNPAFLSDEQKAEDDGGQKYILDDRLSGDPLTMQYVADSFQYNNNETADPSKVNFINDHSILGFAPSYRGIYKDFDTSKIQDATAQLNSMADYLTGQWTLYFEHQGFDFDEAEKKAKDLRAEDLVNLGFKDYQMNQYRFYEMKPYIYVNQLFYSFNEKCKELTGYRFNLDPLWFNPNNPYWKSMVYTLDFLENKNKNSDGDKNIIFNKDTTDVITYNNAPQTRGLTVGPDFNNDFNNDFLTDDNSSYTTIGTSQLQYNNGSSIANVNGKINILGFTLHTKVYRYISSDQPGTMKLDDDTLVDIDFKITGANNFNYTKHYWYKKNGVAGNPDLSGDEYIEAINENGSSDRNTCRLGFAIPAQLIETDTNISNPKLSIKIKYTNTTTDPNPTEHGIYRFTFPIASPNPDPHDAYSELIKPNVTPNCTFEMSIDNVYVISGIRYTDLKLNSIYFSKESLFENVILNYTKMFGLIWDIDDQNKEINIMTRYKYFSDIGDIPDWSDKLDRSKDYIVEPVSFNNSFVTFNYEKLDGDKYSSYKDKYGLAYGEKKIDTRYCNDGKEKKLFTKIYPSLSESKVFLNFDDVVNWNINGEDLLKKADLKQMMACESKDGKSSISTTNFYLRCQNIELDNPTYITQDSQVQIAENTFCYYSPQLLATGIANENVPVTSFPIFSPVLKTDNTIYNEEDTYYGALFTCPQEDYTYNNSIGDANGKFIYDRFWRDYIDERYNIQNKKLTAYFRISPLEFNNFKYNKLITLDNQLFMINKICDFDIASTDTVKCELIQVTDINAYKSGSIFQPITCDYNEVVLDKDDDTKTVRIISSSPLTDWKIAPSNNDVVIEDIEQYNHGMETLITISSYRSPVWNGSLMVTSEDGDTLSIDIRTKDKFPMTVSPESLDITEDGDYYVTCTTGKPVNNLIKVRYNGQYGTVDRNIPAESIGNNKYKCKFTFSGFNGHIGTYSGEIIISNGDNLKHVPFTVTIS